MARNDQAIQDFIRSTAGVRNIARLSAPEESTFIRQWQDHGNIAARDEVLKRHLPLCVKQAIHWARTNPVDPEDLFGAAQEAMLKAIDKFDATKGARFSTYSVMWMNAGIREHIHNYSGPTKLTNSAQEKYLYGNWKQLNQDAVGNGDISSAERHQRIAILASERCGKPVSAKMVGAFEGRLGGAMALDAPIGEDGGSFVDLLADDRPTQEETLLERDTHSRRMVHLRDAFNSLNEREQAIIAQRHLAEDEDKATLEDLSRQFNVSRERIRQIEVKALEKLTKRVQSGMNARPA